MTEFFKLEPEVAGGWGPDTSADTSVHPPVVRRLEYTFDGWLGDELLETFPCFIASERLAESMIAQSLTGFALDEVKVSVSSEFLELHPSVLLPRFRWLRVSGTAGQHDFALTRGSFGGFGEGTRNP
jgi:hypothetical protein